MPSVIQYHHPAGAVVEYTPKTSKPRRLNVAELMAMLTAGTLKRQEENKGGKHE